MTLCLWFTSKIRIIKLFIIIINKWITSFIYSRHVIVEFFFLLLIQLLPHLFNFYVFVFSSLDKYVLCSLIWSISWSWFTIIISLLLLERIFLFGFSVNTRLILFRFRFLLVFLFECLPVLIRSWYDWNFLILRLQTFPRSHLVTLLFLNFNIHHFWSDLTKKCRLHFSARLCQYKFILGTWYNLFWL